MSTHDMSIANQTFPAFRADLNSALGALASSSSNTSEPPVSYAHQVWANATATDTKIHRSDVFIFIYPLNKFRLFFFPKSP